MFIKGDKIQIITNILLYKYYQKNYKKRVRIEYYFNTYKEIFVITERSIYSQKAFNLYYRFKNNDIMSLMIIRNNYKIVFYFYEYRYFKYKYEDSEKSFELEFSKHITKNNINYFVYRFENNNHLFGVITDGIKRFKQNLIHDLMNNLELHRIISHDHRIRLYSFYRQIDIDQFYGPIIDVTRFK